MKLLTATLIILTISSCQKRTEYKCVCTGGWGGTDYREFMIKSASIEKARVKCYENGSPIGSNDGMDCRLEQ